MFQRSFYRIACSLEGHIDETLMRPSVRGYIMTCAVSRSPERPVRERSAQVSTIGRLLRTGDDTESSAQSPLFEYPARLPARHEKAVVETEADNFLSQLRRS